MRFTFPPAVSEPLKGSPSHQPHGINSHYGPGKPQSSAYISSPGFHQAGSPLAPGTADTYSLSPLRPPSVLPQPPAAPQQPDGSVTFLPRAALGPAADKREEAAVGLSVPPNRELAELPGSQDGALGTMSQSELEKQRQRQRLRELLIRQQMQRNSLRQEKENAAAAATPSPAGWTPEAGSAAFELSRAMAPGYQPAQDKGLLGTLATAASAGKLPGSVMVQAAFGQDERLSRPPPAPTPTALDINGSPTAKRPPPPPLPAPGLELPRVPPRPLSSGSALRPDECKDSPAPDPAPAPTPGKSHLSLEGTRLPCEVPVEPDLDDDFGSHKDLEDDDDLANLSLDPDVAKGDDDLDNLDSLETADPHLDDLLNGDEFDLLAYTDPELDTGDKKDIFNEHLRLVESANEKAEREAQLKTEPLAPGLKLPSPGDGKDAMAPSVEDRVVPKDTLVPRVGLGPSPCPPGAVLAPGVEAKAGSLPTDVKPKLEDGCLKTSPCQFTAGGPEQLPGPVKSEALQGTDKISASLGLSLKPGQTLLSPGAGPARLGLAHFAPGSHAGVPTPEKDPYAGRGLAPAQLGNQGNPLLEKFELDGGSLGLGSARHSPADDLDKMESSLVASELPLLIEDLLEHEKKELQKKQQMSAQLPRSTPHLPGHPLLPPEGQPPRLGTPQPPLQLGLVARPPLMPPQPPRLGTAQQGPALTPHMGMAPAQPHVLAASPGVQVALAQPQQNQQQVLVQKPMAGVQPPGLGLKPPQLVMQQQLANSFFPDTDLDKFAAEDIMDPIAKAKMVALKGIKKVMAQGSIGVAPGMNRQQVSLLAQRLSGGPAVSEMQNHLLAGSGQQLLQMQLKVLEEQIGAHRKSRKALCAKQRTAKKAGREFPEADAEKLKLVTEQQSKIQKQLDQVRKQQKEHTNLMAEYRNKQQQHQHQASAVMALSPSQSPRLMSKLPGQLLSAHGVQQPTGTVVGAQGLGQQPGQPGGLRLPQGGVSMAVPQSLPFMGQQGVGNAPVPGTSNAFFSGNPTLRGLAADSRLLQERQLQRMQLAQKLQQQNMLGQVSLQQQAGMMGQTAMQQQGVMGQASLQQPSVMAQTSMQQPGAMGQASMQQQSVMGQAAMQPQGMMAQTSLQQPGVMGQAAMPQLGMMAQTTSLQQQGVMGQAAMQQPGIMGQASMPQPGVMAQPALSQPGVMGQGSLQPGLLGQQQAAAAPQPGAVGQPLVPKQPGLLGSQQSLLVQQLSPQQQPGLLGHTPAPGLQHQAVLGHPPPQRQLLLGPHQQRVLGSPQLPPQTPGVLGHRLVLSQQLGQSRALLAPQQQQNSAVAQPGLLGVGQGQPPIQHFPQHGGVGQAPPSALHLSQGLQPAPAVLPAKDQPAGADGSALPAEGSKSGGQLHGGPQEQPGALNPPGLGSPEPPAPQLLLASPQPALRAAPVQPGPLLAPPLQSPGAPQPELSQQQGDAAGLAEPPLGCGTGQAPGMALPPAPRPPEQVGKGPSGLLQGQPQPPRLQSPGQHKAGPAALPTGVLGQVPGQVMGQIRAQLQGVLAKNPQLRHLTPQQQQQLQALLVQRHQQNLLQQSPALLPPSPFPGQAPEHGAPAARQPPHQLGPLFQPQPGAPAEPQTSFATEQGRGGPGQPPQQPLAELVQAALAARGPQPGPVRLPTPPAPEQSPQEPKKTFPGVPASAPSPAEPGLTPTASGPLPAPPHGSWDPEVPSTDPADPGKTHINGAALEGAPAAGETAQVLVKQEPKEEAAVAPCELDKDEVAKPEANGDTGSSLSSSALAAGGRSEAGHLLLQKLLRAKNVQLSAQSPGELNGHTESRGAGTEPRPQPVLLGREDPTIARKPAATKPKRVQKGNERVPASRKKLRKDEGLRPGEALMRQLKQELSLLPLTEPNITANFSLFAPFGSSPINGKSQLRGGFGSAVLDSVPDYYSQLLTKNNLSNPPTPPSSLPPTPPPSVQQKMVNGVTVPEELGEQPKDTDPAREPHGQKDTPAMEVKSLDLLAALPTPPHNQTEDVRMESDDESDSPDSIVPASSPESVLGEELLRFPLLSEAKAEREERVLSPIIPIIPRASIPVFPDTKPYETAETFGVPPGKAGAAGPGAPWEKGRGSEVSVMLTVSAAAAKNLNGVMVAMAELLSVKIPSSYEVLFPDGPVRAAVVETKKVETDMAGVLGAKEKAALAGKVPDGSSEWLKQFDAVLPGYSLKGELDLLTLLRQKGGAKRDGDKEIAEFIDKLGTTLRPEKVPRDLRKCCFCHEEGDGATDGPARLLNLDLDLWVHLNCALWSTEVYETQGGALINVEVALHRGLLTKCSLCQRTGATNSCNRIRCPSVYHFACAIRAKCMFFKDKTMLCPLHKLKGPCEQELSSFTVFRRVYIERDEVKQIASIIQRGERLHMFRVGGLVFHAIGQLLPHQMADFHSVTALYPVGYEATRIYWSLRTNNRRCCYRCTICENNGRPEFVVQVIEQGLEDLVFSDSSPQADMLRLFPEYLKGEELFGLTVHAVLRIAESAYQSTFTGETNTPYSKQFVHSKSSQYRRLKTEWKNNVYLARSRIQGLGLYAAKDIEKHTMVIEYIGTIIRNEVANRREKIYEEQNRGIYMFRINNEHVIDATLTGGPARYINHSCAPNCVAEVVTFDKEDKIIIISSRRIPKGEELTYDYQFDFEDDQHKIPCHCGAWNCRKWMN
ncbi:Kmt2d [Columba guinea]|nr:Kmt2d [Columba guinea]